MERLTIDEAIVHAREVAENKYKEGMLCHANPDDGLLDGCIKCAREHEQLAEWLKELKNYKDLEGKGRLIELKPIKDFEELYAVDMFGEVYGIAKQNKNGRRILKRKATKSKQNGYMYITLKDNGRSKNARVHRLVAEAFIPNPNNFPDVNHIDGNKENNCVWNLEWCTKSHNSQHAVENGLLKPPTNKVDGVYRNGKNKYIVIENIKTNAKMLFTNTRKACAYINRGHDYIWQHLSKNIWHFASREYKVSVFLTKEEAEQALAMQKG